MWREITETGMDGTASISCSGSTPLVLVFGAADSGQPTLQLRDCGVICALGTLQLAPGQGDLQLLR